MKTNRNRNPLNVKQNPANRWRGAPGMDERGHAVFENEAWGIRAAVRTLAQKYANGKQTLIAITSDWAPKSDTQGSVPGNPPNNPVKYAAFVAARLPYDEMQVLPLFERGGAIRDYTLLVHLIRAMATYENGHDYVLRDSWIMEGIGLYLKTYVEGRA